jgi:hypothetical protein
MTDEFFLGTVPDAATATLRAMLDFLAGWA